MICTRLSEEDLKSICQSETRITHGCLVFQWLHTNRVISVQDLAFIIFIDRQLIMYSFRKQPVIPTTHYSDSPLLRRPIFPTMQNRTQSTNPWFNQVYPTGWSVSQANSSVILSFSCFSRFTLFFLYSSFLVPLCNVHNFFFNF
jgi:hypothetical protein